MLPLLALGGALGLGGTLLSGKSGDRTRKRLEALANEPGVDYQGLSREALGSQLGLLPQAERLSGETARINQANLLGMEEASLPGVGAARQSALTNALSFLGDDAQWLQGVQRRGAAMGIGRGLGGSAASQIGMLRLSDQESQQRRVTGAGLLQNLIASLRIAQSPGVESFFGPSANQVVGLRSQERAQRMGLLGQAYQVPGMTASFGSFLSGVGGQMAGLGAGLMMGGGGAGGSGGGGFGPQSRPGGYVTPLG